MRVVHLGTDGWIGVVGATKVSGKGPDASVSRLLAAHPPRRRWVAKGPLIQPFRPDAGYAAGDDRTPAHNSAGEKSRKAMAHADRDHRSPFILALGLVHATSTPWVFRVVTLRRRRTSAVAFPP